jgi:D-threo-aldose 1-dehydrogenase
MEYRVLGATGLRVSALGLGAAGIGQLYENLSDAEGAAVVRQALDLGITYIDTAPLYGSGVSERRIGLALQGDPRASECVVATKIGYYPEGFDHSYDATMRSVEDSLRRLGLSVLPLVQVHEIEPETWPKVFARDGALAALRALQGQGLIRQIGVTGSHLPTVAAAIETGEFATVLIWRHYHLLDSTGAAVIGEAARRGMGIIIGTPFAGGILASGDTPNAHYFYKPAGPDERTRTRAIEEECAAQGVPLAAAALRFCLRPPRVATVIAGADHPSHVERNVRTLEQAVPEPLLDELERRA